MSGHSVGCFSFSIYSVVFLFGVSFLLIVMAKIGLVAVDGYRFPNVALMKICGWHRSVGDTVEWAVPLSQYDRIYMSKVFTFSPDDRNIYQCPDIRKGGTGYDIKSKLPAEIDGWSNPDYSVFPQHRFSIQFYSRGCIRHCPFCLVHDKEGEIHPVHPMKLNPQGKWVEVLDNNFFANPEWREAVKDLRQAGQPVKFHGVDIRLLDVEQAEALKSLSLKNGVHVAWDLPQIDLSERLEMLTQYIKANNIVCYVLVGFNSTPDQDLSRLRFLKKLGILPFVQPFRDFENRRQPSQYEKDLARWANRAWLFRSVDFLDYMPRRGFRCSKYFES